MGQPIIKETYGLMKKRTSLHMNIVGKRARFGFLTSILNIWRSRFVSLSSYMGHATLNITYVGKLLSEDMHPTQFGHCTTLVCGPGSLVTGVFPCEPFCLTKGWIMRAIDIAYQG